MGRISIRLARWHLNSHVVSLPGGWVPLTQLKRRPGPVSHTHAVCSWICPSSSCCVLCADDSAARDIRGAAGAHSTHVIYTHCHSADTAFSTPSPCGPAVGSLMGTAEPVWPGPREQQKGPVGSAAPQPWQRSWGSEGCKEGTQGRKDKTATYLHVSPCLCSTLQLPPARRGERP